MAIRKGSRLSEEDVKARLYNRKINLLNQYTIMRDVGHFECNVCGHRWKSQFQGIVSQGQGCPRCAGVYKTKETINKELKDKPFKLIEEYKNSKDKHKFECNCGNIFEMTISSAYARKRGCGKCNKNKFRNDKELFDIRSYKCIESFYNTIKELNYEILSDYKNTSSYVKLKCNKHNETWDTRVGYIINGHGRCKKCKEDKILNDRIERQKYRFNEKIKKDMFIKMIGEFKGFDCETDFECLNCGNIYNTKPIYYYYHNSRCPKCSASKGELAIMEYLEKNNIKYKHEYYFEDFKGKNGRHYRFDFAILGKRNGVKALIEYDGILHYKNKFKGQDIFECINRDNVKSKYAKSKKIKLIRIPYWDIENIEQILQMELKGVI